MMTLHEQQRYRKRMLNTIGHRSGLPASNSIGANLLEREVHRYLNSGAVQSAVLEEIWRKKFGSDEAQLRWRTSQQAPLIARDYRRFRSCPVEWHHKPRRTSGYRKLCNFSDVEKMWHRLASDLIVAQHRPQPHIGDWPGRGRDMQMKQICAAICSGAQFVVCADVRTAFASVCTDALYQLPFLPEPIIRRAIDYRTHRFVRRERRTFASKIALAMPDNLEVPPSGLMEGSPASNAIFAFLLDDLPDHLSDNIVAFCYCDNIILIATDIVVAQQAEIALIEYFASHRAGPFDAVTSLHSVREPFEHLGYTLQWEDGLRVRLSPNNWCKLMERVENDSFAETLLWLQSSFGRCSNEEVWNYVYVALEEHYARMGAAM
jgi:hypothetical protein